MTQQEAMDRYKTPGADTGNRSSFREYLNDNYKGGADAYRKKTAELSQKFRTEAAKSIDNLLSKYGDMPLNRKSKGTVRDVLTRGLAPALDFKLDTTLESIMVYLARKGNQQIAIID